jgi:CubicO group peptidase (beta-lactamase class C family)
MKKFLKAILYFFAALFSIALAYVLITFPPVMAGMAAKTMCSCVFVAGRDPQSVREKELQVFPGLSNAPITIHKDSSVTATVFWKTSKAIFRRGLGCTLLAQRSENELRSQRFLLPAGPELPADTTSWSTGDNLSHSLPDPAHSAIDMKALTAALDAAFDESDPQRPVNTHAIIVLYQGHIVAERYANRFHKDSRQMGWSMTKSVTNALIGILVKQGKLKVHQQAPVPEWSSDERRNITIDNLLQASSGLAWSESYFSPTADFHRMFIKSDDKGGYAMSKKLAHDPGAFFQYSSGSTNILSKIIRQTVGDSVYHKFPYEQLFYKIGMNTAIMEPDASGTFVASSYSFASARDWARFGLLYLNDGVWNGKSILPEGWVKYSTTPAPASELGRYGAHWWLNAGEPGNASNRKYPELPADTFWADGFEEQYVMVIPSKKLVIVRLGVSHHGFDIVGLAQQAMRAVEGGNGE